MLDNDRGSSPFYTIPELYEANERKIGINQLRAWAREGRIKSVQVGRKRLIPKTELANLVKLGGQK
jgi:excisionase family DNA binding protein